MTGPSVVVVAVAPGGAMMEPATVPVSALGVDVVLPLPASPASSIPVHVVVSEVGPKASPSQEKA